MSRMLAPDDACKGVDVPFGRAKSYDGNIISVTDPAHARALRAAGYSDASIAGTPARAAGRQCGECGFNGWFKVCGRCGGECTTREA
jgi:hypothetical protein